jgi:hypothetical protein
MYKVKVTSSVPVSVRGLGILQPGTNEITEEQAARFEHLNGYPLEESTLDVSKPKKTQPKKEE